MQLSGRRYGSHVVAVVSAFVFSLFAATLTAQADDGCSVNTPAHCGDTSELVRSRGFASEIGKFLGEARADYLYPGNHPVSEQLLSVIGGPPDVPRRIGTFWLFTACRFHSCDEKGAVVLRPDGEPVAVAILHTLCGKPNRDIACASRDVLSIYWRPPLPQWETISDALSAWGKSAANAGADVYDRTESIALAPPRPADAPQLYGPYLAARSRLVSLGYKPIKSSMRPLRKIWSGAIAEAECAMDVDACNMNWRAPDGRVLQVSTAGPPHEDADLRKQRIVAEHWLTPTELRAFGIRQEPPER
jgi:hypothetical protein